MGVKVEEKKMVKPGTTRVLAACCRNPKKRCFEKGHWTWIGSGQFRAVAWSEKERRYSPLFPTEREAKQHATQWRQDLAAKRGQFAPRRAPTFTVLAEQWLAHVEALRAIRPGTVVNYRGFVEGHLLGPHGFGDLPITDVTPQKIRAFITTMRATGSVRWKGRGLATSSLRVGLAALRLLLQQAVEDGHLDVSPLSKMGTVLPRRAGEGKKTIDPFTRDELRRIFAAADARDVMFGTLFRLWAGSGLRRGGGRTWISGPDCSRCGAR